MPDDIVTAAGINNRRGVSPLQFHAWFAKMKHVISTPVRSYLNPHHDRHNHDYIKYLISKH